MDRLWILDTRNRIRMDKNSSRPDRIRIRSGHIRTIYIPSSNAHMHSTRDRSLPQPATSLSLSSLKQRRCTTMVRGATGNCGSYERTRPPAPLLDAEGHRTHSISNATSAACRAATRPPMYVGPRAHRRIRSCWVF